MYFPDWMASVNKRVATCALDMSQRVQSNVEVWTTELSLLTSLKG